ncbi:phage tail fiber protein [Paenibacillus donghaensis]|uniref:Uncharacterized protein n=1 Tax=Paenibacillus donghaensis TaxID=414771 RepID=A0A2Z2K9H1_9BACL|nr:hypothetical protein [Paenibacillus donghaensis]ASA22077.1 hypothetical protein B9T62_15615 [Paenibacillus donghaensis]
MNVSDYLAKVYLNLAFRNTPFTPPAALFVALYTSNPTKVDTGLEVSGGAYVRRAVTFAAPAAVSGIQTIKNTAEIAYPLATANWGQITHIGIRDAATGGNLLYFGELTDSRSILTGDIFKFVVGELQLTQR